MFNIQYFKGEKIVEEPMPEWLTEERYRKSKSKYVIAWTLGFPTYIPCERILTLKPQQIYVMSQLLNTNIMKFRSKFRKSLRCRLDTWLDDDDSDYFSPFSNKQWDSLINNQVTRNTLRLIQNLHRIIMAKDE